MKGRTTVIIAHRMSTIEKCDKLFYIERGKVAESGTYKELSHGNGLFAKMHSAKNHWKQNFTEYFEINNQD